jgi:hypothetical protein
MAPMTPPFVKKLAELIEMRAMAIFSQAIPVLSLIGKSAYYYQISWCILKVHFT